MGICFPSKRPPVAIPDYDSRLVMITGSDHFRYSQEALDWMNRHAENMGEVLMLQQLDDTPLQTPLEIECLCRLRERAIDFEHSPHHVEIFVESTERSIAKKPMLRASKRCGFFRLDPKGFKHLRVWRVSGDEVQVYYMSVESRECSYAVYL